MPHDVHETQPVIAPRLVSADETARALGVSVRYVRMAIADGAITVVRLGRRTMIPVAELDRVVRDGWRTEVRP